MGICQSQEDQTKAGGGSGGGGGGGMGGGDLIPVVTKLGQRGAHHVRNIFATPFEMMENIASFRPPVFEHTKEETELIKGALKKNIVFEEMSAKEVAPLVKAFEKTSVEPNAEIIKQGDEGTYCIPILLSIKKLEEITIAVAYVANSCFSQVTTSTLFRADLACSKWMGRKWGKLKPVALLES